MRFGKFGAGQLLAGVATAMTAVGGMLLTWAQTRQLKEMVDDAVNEKLANIADNAEEES